MKIAIIGDIHANLPALNAVLDDAHKRDAELILNVGDMIGYGASPDEAVLLIRKKNIASILGNYDSKAIAIRESSAEGPKSPLKLLAFEWAYDNLSTQSLEFIKSLPTSLRMKIDGIDILLVHGSIESDSEYVDKSTPTPRLRTLAKLSSADVVFSGHSHRPAIRKSGHTIFANTGSVGRPDDGDPRACYAICDIADGKIAIEHIRVEYDYQLAARQIREKGLPDAFAQMILHGKNLDDILESQPETGDSPAHSAAAKIQGNRQTDFDKLPASAMALATRCKYEMSHARQVQRLAMAIFDQLHAMHNLNARCRELLACAAILHDIGWINGQSGHHKTSMKLILGSKLLPLSTSDRLIVANAARYHRKSLPSKSHSQYMQLDFRSRRIARILGGIIRLADGLDVCHTDAIEEVRCGTSGGKILLSCLSATAADAEIAKALKKSDLLSQEFDLPIIIKAAKITTAANPPYNTK